MPTLCVALRQAVNAAKAKDTPKIEYNGFWDSFEERCVWKSIFEYLFSGIGIKKQITIFSVFNSKELPKHDGLYVSFSGEPEVSEFPCDLKLVMTPKNDNKTIITHLFALEATSYGLWSIIQNPRSEFPLNSKKFCSFVVSNPKAELRCRFMQSLYRYKPVDSSGRHLNTTGFLAPEDKEHFGEFFYPFLQQYKFCICFENTYQENYITEKLLNAYAAGCIPIYWGHKSVFKWFNSKAFLYLEYDNFEENPAEAFEKLISKIIRIDQNSYEYWQMYREPLLIGDIPEVMKIKNWKKEISTTLHETRPDLFV